MRFVKLDDLYLNIDSIGAINRESGIVYVANSAGQDVIILPVEAIDRLVTFIESEAEIHVI